MKKNEYEYDKLLTEALKTKKAEQLSSVPSEEEIDHEFSDGFDSAMKTLIRKQKLGVWGKIKSTAQKAAVLIVIIAVSVAVSTGINAGRRPELDFSFTQSSDGVTVAFSSGKDSDSIAYYLPYISDSYAIEGRVYNGMMKIEWYDDNGEYAYFCQYSNEKAQINRDEYESYTTPVINGIKTVFMDSFGDYRCYWVENGYLYELGYSSAYGKDFVYKVIGELYESDVWANMYIEVY